MGNSPETYYELVYAYSAIWLLVVAFVFKLAAGQRKVSARLDRIESQIESTEQLRV